MQPTNPHGHATKGAALTENPIAPGERLVRLPEVMSLTGKGRTQLYEEIKDKTFPAPLKDGRCSLWVLSEIQGWIAIRVATAPRKGASQ